jgi:LPXTG-motif cell wall-anchored protein
MAAAAATSVLSLYGVPAFADSRTDVPANTWDGFIDLRAALTPFLGESRTRGVYSPGSADALHGAGRGEKREEREQCEGREQPEEGEERGRGYGSEYGGGYGADAGYGRHDDHGHNPPSGNPRGYGDEPGYGDSPPTSPPTSPSTAPRTRPPASPPTTATPPTAEPPRSSPPTTWTQPPPEPPLAPPAKPSLPETGSNEQALVASAVAALLLTSGAILYRRGRAASRR